MSEIVTFFERRIITTNSSILIYKKSNISKKKWCTKCSIQFSIKPNNNRLQRIVYLYVLNDCNKFQSSANIAELFKDKS